jgi:hypothetical protein
MARPADRLTLTSAPLPAGACTVNGAFTSAYTRRHSSSLAASEGPAERCKRVFLYWLYLLDEPVLFGLGPEEGVFLPDSRFIVPVLKSGSSFASPPRTITPSVWLCDS